MEISHIQIHATNLLEKSGEYMAKNTEETDFEEDIGPSRAQKFQRSSPYVLPNMGCDYPTIQFQFSIIYECVWESDNYPKIDVFEFCIIVAIINYKL